MRYREMVTGVALCAVASMIGPTAMAEEGGVKAGFLTCHVSSGWGFVFGSSRSINCEYSNGSDKGDHYTGSITKFGVDIGYLSSAVIVWTVVAPTGDVSAGSLAGNYAGATGSAAVGVGVGANTLVGGSGNHFVLQPLSIEGNVGLNVAGGIAALELTAEKS